VLKRLNVRSASLIAFETVGILGAVYLAAFLRLGPRDWLLLHLDLEKALLVTAVCLYYADLYDLRVLADRRELFVRIGAGARRRVVDPGALYYWFPTLIIGRGVFLIAASS
jgi:hypothetical protein